MRSILFLFLDGVGLGKADPLTNPFASARMPGLEALLGGKKLVVENIPLESERATLLGLDAGLGVSGLPQSATGQATLLNGANVPAAIGNHYGPKPNQAVAEIVSESNLFKRLKEEGLEVAFLNAFPPSYFNAVESGRRLYGTIALAAARAGVPLRTMDDLRLGNAVSADFTGQGLHDRLNIRDVPIITPQEAGERLAQLSQVVNFALFEYWLTDYAGHGQEMQAALDLLATFDHVLGSLTSEWNDETGLIVVTSDHGNMEDLSTRRHTDNKVPCLIIGNLRLRREFTDGLNDLTGIAPAILRFFNRV
jgi:2,3-bisphosphoglycerate-independent phosphoglycerate mutase